MWLRALILLLACMNIGVATWWLVHTDVQARPLPVNEPGIASLTLFSESDDASAAAASLPLEAPSAPPLAADAVCQSLGPFETSAALRKAMDALLPKVERIQFREVEAVALRGYRVYLPAGADRAQALATARALSAKGIADYYVVTAGDQVNTVSLGLFRELDNATKRRNDVVALGYNAVVGTAHRAGEAVVGRPRLGTRLRLAFGSRGCARREGRSGALRLIPARPFILALRRHSSVGRATAL